MHQWSPKFYQICVLNLDCGLVRASNLHPLGPLLQLLPTTHCDETFCNRRCDSAASERRAILGGHSGWCTVHRVCYYIIYDVCTQVCVLRVRSEMHSFPLSILLSLPGSLAPDLCLIILALFLFSPARSCCYTHPTPS